MVLLGYLDRKIDLGLFGECIENRCGFDPKVSEEYVYQIPSTSITFSIYSWKGEKWHIGGRKEDKDRVMTHIENVMSYS